MPSPVHAKSFTMFKKSRQQPEDTYSYGQWPSQSSVEPEEDKDTHLRVGFGFLPSPSLNPAFVMRLALLVGVMALFIYMR